MSSGPFAVWRWQSLFKNLNVFFEGFLVTLLVAVTALLLSLIVGAIFGLLSTSRHAVLRGIARAYVEFFQNTPLVIIVFFMFNALPYAKIILDTMTIGIIGIGLYHGAYVAEVVRAGVESIPKGQEEAAHSQGFSYLVSMIYIILPQTIQIILPPLTNQAVNLIKNTSVLAIIAGGDLMYRADSWASNGMLSYAPAYILTGILYFILCFPLASWARSYEKRLKEAGVRPATAVTALDTIPDSD